MATQSHEFKGKTVDDAIDEGLRTLALSRDEVAIEIVQKGSRGIFGLGSEPAIVRLMPQAVASDQPVTPSPAVAEMPPTAESALPALSGVPYGGEEDRLSPLDETEVEEAVANEVEGILAAGTVVVADPLQADKDTVDEWAPVVEAAAGDDATDQELLEMARDLLGQMVYLMGFEAEIRASWQEESDEPGDDQDEEEEEEGQLRTGQYLLLDIEGADLGALIGRRGETLDNMQYLLRLMVNQKIHKWKNIVIDVEHYKARRVTQLTQLAERMAEQVARTGRSLSLEPMPANERRIVHMTLRGHPDVYTESYGDGVRRKVHIFAKT